MATTYVSDAFTGTNGTQLAAHTPDTDAESGGWSEEQGDIEIRSNKAEAIAPGTGTNSHRAVIDAGSAVVKIEGPVTLANPSGGEFSAVGFMLRYQDIDNHWLARISMFNGGRLELFERSGGTSTLRAEFAMSPSAGETWTVKAIAHGTTIDIQANNGTDYGHIRYESSSFQTETTHGIQATQSGTIATGNGCKWDNFTITDIAKVTIVPNGDGTLGAWTDDGGGTTDIYDHVNAGVDTPNDSDYIKTSTTSSPCFLLLGDMPSSCDTIESVTAILRGNNSGGKSPLDLGSIQLVKSDESTALTDQESEVFNSSTVVQLEIPMLLTGDTDKSSYDGARSETISGASGSGELDVTEVAFEVFYLVGAPAVTADFVMPAEWRSEMTVDAAVLPEWQLNVRRDRVLNVSWRGGPNLTADLLIPLSWLQGARKDNALDASWRRSLVSDSQINAEWRGQTDIVLDSILALDWRQQLHRDGTFPASWLLSVRRDQALSTSWKRTIAGDGASLVEWNRNTEPADAVLPVVWSPGVSVAFVIDAEWLLQLVLDATADVDWVVNLRRDHTSPLAWQQSSRADATLPASWLQGARNDGAMSLEWAGRASAFIDAVLAIEWIVELAVDGTLPSDWRAEISEDRISSVEWLLSASRDHQSPVSWKNELQRDHQSPLAWQLSVRLDHQSPVAWRQGISAAATLAASWGGSAAGVFVIPASWKGSLLRDGTLPSVWRGGVAAAAILPSEWKGSLEIDSGVPVSWPGIVASDEAMDVEWRALLEIDRTAAAAWQLSARRDATLPVVWLQGIGPDQVIPSEWLAGTIIDSSGGVWALGPRGTVWKLPARGTVWSLPERGTVWELKR